MHVAKGAGSGRCVSKLQETRSDFSIFTFHWFHVCCSNRFVQTPSCFPTNLTRGSEICFNQTNMKSVGQSQHGCVVEGTLFGMDKVLRDTKMKPQLVASFSMLDF